MKKRFLPLGLFSFIILCLAGIFIFSSGTAEKEVSPVKRGAQSIAGAKAYLASLRNNQHTGVLDPKDVIAASQEFDQQANLKSSQEFTWDELGPDNMGGRTRALMFDNRDATGKTIYAGSVTGGLFKTINEGSTWSKINTGSGTACLNVTSMVQTSNGTIYVGTGEGLGSDNYTAYGQLGYEGGFVGKGIFKSNNNDGFNLVAGTAPVIQGEVTEWAYINDLAIDKNNNRLYAATHTGLKYAGLPELSNWNSDLRYKLDSAIIYRTMTVDSVVSCDSIVIENGEVIAFGEGEWDITVTGDDTTNQQSIFSEYISFAEQGNCFDVKVSDNGVLYTTVQGRVYVSESGNPTKLENKSIYPENVDFARKDNIEWTSTVTYYDQSGNILHSGGSVSSQEYDWHTDYKDPYNTNLAGYPSSDNPGRTEFAVSPSDQSVVYAQVAKGLNPNVNSLLGTYVTEDNGKTWRAIAPGGSSSLNILGSFYGASNTPYYQGDYNNTIVVFPNNPYKVLAGGIDLWIGEKVNETGYYNWERKSSSEASLYSIFAPIYCHMDHHAYVFQPTNGNKVFIGTDGGIFLGSTSGSDITFAAINKNYNVAQFYTLDISLFPNEFVGGAQDIGTVYAPGTENTGKLGVDLWRTASYSAAFPTGTDGGSVGYTTLGYIDVDGSYFYPPVFYSKSPLPNSSEDLIDRMRRSETLGFDYSLDFLSSDINDTRFITPFAVWESYDNQNSYVYVTWFADKDYSAGDPIVVRSNNFNHPFNYILEEDISQGDSLEVKDIITNKAFIGIEDEVFMSLNTTDFSVAPDWFLISEKNSSGVEGFVQAIAYSADANYLWAGTDEGRLFRISNIANAHDENTADLSSPNCVIATTEVILPGDITQVITSIAVDPKDANKVLVTLGNYGNNSHVYYSTNGTADTPEFANKQGNLPKMPVYASILEMDENTDQAILGTEMGLWTSDDISTGEWTYAGDGIGRIPVMAVKQRTFYKSSFTTTFVDPVTGAKTYEIYPAIMNYKDIFVATHGRGVFKYDVSAVGIDEEFENPGIAKEFSINVYPNPVSTQLTIDVDLTSEQDILIRVVDFSGKLMMSDQTGKLNSGKQSHTLNLSNVPEGSYLVQCIAGRTIVTKKIIVVK